MVTEEVLQADGEGAAGRSAVAVQDGVGGQLVYEQDDVILGGAVAQERPERGAYVPNLVGSDDEIERKITVRLSRQERLTGDDPPEYWVVMNEAVIRRIVGGAEAMRGQLNHIAEVAKLSHVNVQVLPFGAGVHPAMDGAFSILGFPEATDPDVVYLENQAGSLYLEEEAEIDRYARMFSHLMAKALDPEESRRMIARLANDLTELPT